MAVPRRTVALAALLGALMVAYTVSATTVTVASSYAVPGVRWNEIAGVALFYAAPALQWYASRGARAEQQAAAALWISGGIAAGALPSGVVAAVAMGEVGETYFWWTAGLQIAAALAVAAIVGWRRRGQRGVPTRPVPGGFVFAALALVVAVHVALASIAQLAYRSNGYDYDYDADVLRFVVMQVVGPLFLVGVAYALTGLSSRLGRFARLAVAGVVAGIALSGLAAAAIRPYEVPWSLETVGPGGRSLVIQATDDGRCGQLRGEVIDRTSAAVRIRVTRTPVRCVDLATGYSGPQTTTVTLDRALHGERITGPRMDPSTGGRIARVKRAMRLPDGGWRRYSGRLPMPRVTGLSPDDAGALLGRGNDRLGVVTWAGAGRDGRVVVAQTPSGRAPLEVPIDDVRRWSTTPITLTTAE